MRRETREVNGVSQTFGFSLWKGLRRSGGEAFATRQCANTWGPGPVLLAHQERVGGAGQVDLGLFKVRWLRVRLPPPPGLGPP